jgi:TetR/AcrR family transcriptional regulator, fatty acid metabolism regulator protein
MKPFKPAPQPLPTLAQKSKRERILDAGLKLFAHESYQAVTMDRVAQEAGVAKGTLYLYFPSKEELYLGILKNGFETVNRLYNESVEEGTDVRERVRRAIAIGIGFYSERRDLLRLFATEEPRMAEARDRILRDRREESIALYASLIEEGQRRGIFAHCDPHLAALMILGAVRSVLLYYETNRDVEEIARDLPNLLLRAISTREVETRELLRAG